MMQFDFMKSDEDGQVRTTNVEDSTSHQTDQVVGKHPLLDTSNFKSTEPPAKRMRSSPRRISCKARGLSNSHNADNAYFEIPPGAPHGLSLRCSDAECASSGRRFRYCQVCKVPVAKRNFLQRHGHGMLNTAMQLRSEVDNRCHPCASPGTTPQTSEVHVIEELRTGVRIANTGHPRDASAAGPSDDQILDFREKKWLRLLHERPIVYDPTHMMNWLNKVLSFSEHAMDTFPSTISCIGAHTPLFSSGSDSVHDAGISVDAMERFNFGPLRNAQIQTYPSTTSTIDLQMPHVPFRSESDYDAGVSVAAMEHNDFGLSRSAQIQTLSSSTSHIDVHGPSYVSPCSESVYDAGISVGAIDRLNFGPLINAQIQRFPATASCIDVHVPLMSPSSEPDYDDGIFATAMERHNLGPASTAQIQTFPSTTISCINNDGHGIQAPASGVSLHDAGISLVAMECHNFGLYNHSSSSTLETTGFLGQTTTHENATDASDIAEHDDCKTASEIAEFNDFMNGIDTSFPFV